MTSPGCELEKQMPLAGAGDQVAELVRVLALAWKNLASYPPGHPALDGALELVKSRLDDLRGPAPEVAFGVSVDGLIYGEDKIQTPYIQKFVHALYTRGIALLRFDATTSPTDIEAFLRLLRAGVVSEDGPPIWDELRETGVTSIALDPVDYSAVQVTDTLDSPGALSDEPESLSDAILRALVAGRELSAESQHILTAGVHSFDELAELILRYSEEVKPEEIDFDSTFGVPTPGATEVPDTPEAVTARVAVGVGMYVARSSGLRKQLAVQQLTQILRAFPEQMRASVLRSAVGALAVDESAGALFGEFASTFRENEILTALNHLPATTKLSTHAINLIESLSAVQREAAVTKTESEGEFPELTTLFGEEDIDRFNPSDHRALLEEVTVRVPHAATTGTKSIGYLGSHRVETVSDEAVRHQLLQTLLDLLSSAGTRSAVPVLDRIESLFREHAEASRFAEAFECADQLRKLAAGTRDEHLRAAIEKALAKLAAAEVVETLIDSIAASPPGDLGKLQELMRSLGPAALRGLLIALTEEENRSRRRRLFDFVTSLGPFIIREARSFLGDERWYVVRNMIVLLRAVDDHTSLGEIRRCAQHHDLRVRLEAIKTLLALDPQVPQTLLEHAINDPDPKLAETAIKLVGSYGIREGVGPLLKICVTSDFFGSRTQIRLLAIQVLAELADPSALPRMKKLFSNSILPWPLTVERRAAYESLAGYPADARGPLVAKGLRSRDPVIREVCERIRGEVAE